MHSRSVHWFRHDLRLRDNAALAAAAEADELIALFVLDDALLEGSRSGAPRVRFLLASLEQLAKDLEARGSRLVVRRGDPASEIARLLDETKADRLCFGRSYAPAALRRDERVRAVATKRGVRVVETRDHVVFESRDVLSQQDRPFAVFTPYRRAWLRAFEAEPQIPLRAPKLPPTPAGVDSLPLPPSPASPIELPVAGEAAAARRLSRFLERSVADYARSRDFPAEDATSRLSPHLRFGTISARTCVHLAREIAAIDPKAAKGANKWIDELLWREFYCAILKENPHVTRSSHRSEYDAIEWNDDEEGFRAWCEGRTGYPIVDAGMRQLATTGWMHNRVRMIAASFLTKDLLVDWRRGEEFFYRSLIDGDPASNNGGWQWAASTGTDAQPYFRIFNPVSQGERFDPAGRYVRRFVPELEDVGDRFVQRPWEAPSPPRDYPAPIVSHHERRVQALRRYEAARERGGRS